MNIPEGLQPQKVFKYFERICQIPHGSGNIEQISNYIADFAKERGLFCIQDELKNIIIIKEATPGYEQEEPYILQGHMDMVAVKEPGCEIDMAVEPLRLKAENGRIYAEGTSLGGDDGIAVAYCLALLDTPELAHPRLEIILTVDEETGMEGALGIDLSMLQGKRMINLDQEEEGIFITSCAGGARVDVTIPVQRVTVDRDGDKMSVMELKITGLAGGHSGTEIDKKGGNANVLLGQLLEKIMEQTDAMLLFLQGGVADNAIPKEACARIVVSDGELERIQKLIMEQERYLKEQLSATDPEFMIECNILTASEKKALPEAEKSDSQIVCCTEETGRNALACLDKLPNGVIAMSRDVVGLVETSLNLGIMKLTENALVLEYAVRSSVDHEKEALCSQMKAIATQYGAKVTVRNAYPGWAYRADSSLRNHMCTVYEKMYGHAPKLEAIHAGLECGILAGKIPGLDCISIGPDLKDVHTAQESMDIASVQRVWEYLLAVLVSK